ncbi:MAG: DUF6065 family protein [Janthinobacterium lividum]
MADGSIQPYSEGVLEVVKLIEQGRSPKRADRSAGGALPGRAMRFCDSLTTATGYGYWLFPPIDLQLMWDGEQIFWSYENAAAWLPLSGTASGAAQFPGFASRFDEIAPEHLQGCAPPFLTALPELGGVQIWTGLVARTKPGWSLNVRLPVNLPGIPGLSAWEGIVETDHWFGPLFTNFRITRTDFPVLLRAHVPFMQIQPVPQIAYRDDTLNALTVKTASAMSDEDWADFGDVLIPDEAKLDHQGTYAVRARKRRACPYHAALQRQSVI